MKRVIITGAAGFVGSNIVAAFLEAGWFVYAADLEYKKPEFSRRSTDSLQLVGSDCLDLPALDAEALIHAAAVTATPAERGETPEANLRANIEPMLSVMEYANRQGIGRSVYLSSAAALGLTPARSIDESRSPQPRSVYGLAKAIMENTIETMRRDYRREFICVRLGAIYGPCEFARATRPKLSMVARMIIAALTRGEIIVDRPAARRQWTYAPDIGRALVALVDADKLDHGLYNLCGDARPSNLDVAAQITELLSGVALRIAEAEAPEPTAASFGWLDNSRLRRDIGFSDWTGMSAPTLEATLRSIRLRMTDA